MQPEIQTLAEKKLVGIKMSMSLADNKTGLLWQGFMPRHKEIINKLNNDLISMQVYPSIAYFESFNPEVIFTKWAAVEVTDFENIPSGMETFLLQGGLYAVFLHKGAASTGAATFQYIFGTWLPGSEYLLDDRPHFEVLGKKYKNDSPDSEEKIWIPIKLKK